MITTVKSLEKVLEELKENEEIGPDTIIFVKQIDDSPTGIHSLYVDEDGDLIISF